MIIGVLIVIIRVEVWKLMIDITRVEVRNLMVGITRVEVWKLVVVQIVYCLSVNSQNERQVWVKGENHSVVGIWA